ncbi:MAG: helix-turn-helix domain-containing protein [Clostridiales bacterium]|nr:helix-turn-helix domain-containing protein [Clostridiales bacterium]
MNRLRELRKEKNLRQIDVARLCGVAPATYSYWESGHNNIKTENLFFLSEFYNVSIDYLLNNNPLFNGDEIQFYMFNQALKENGVTPAAVSKLSKSQIKIISDLIKNFS